MLRPGAAEENEAEDDAEAAALRERAGEGAGAWKVMGTSFAVVFVGEWGTPRRSRRRTSPP